MSEYPAQDPGPTVVQGQTSTMAIISLIAGILGWTVIPLIGSIVAVITGHMAKKEIRESNGTLTGDGLATFGLVLGYASLVVGICGACIFAVLFLLPFLGVAFSDFSLQLPLLALF